MKRHHIFIICFLLPFFIFAQRTNVAYNNYINNYQAIAKKQQKTHGIPASIILAQGLLESSAGRSLLAKKANNHFGIKCSDWKGERIYYDDDHKGECFRKYKRVLDSFEDHSVFLTKRPRYKSLFQLSPTDYKGWAKGLKKAGYATDPAYAHKLISIIEEYELHRFDLVSTTTKGQKRSKQSKHYQRKLSPMSDSKPQIGRIIDYPAHKCLKVNGLRYVVALPGDTYEGIADEFAINPQKIFSYNEVSSEVKPRTGQRVFLEKKKRKAKKGFENHTIQEGESLYSIAQYYGIRLIDLYDMNKIPYTERARVGAVIRLRPLRGNSFFKK